MATKIFFFNPRTCMLISIIGPMLVLKDDVYRLTQSCWSFYCSLQYMYNVYCFTLSWPYKTSWTMASFRLSTVSGVWRVESDEVTFQNKYSYEDIVVFWWRCSGTDRAVQVRALAEDIVLCSWARHLTLTVPLSLQQFKWVPLNCGRILKNCRGVRAMD